MYRGEPGKGVTVNGAALMLYLDEVNHSPTGCSWGYCGSGPAQLSYAILRHEYGKDYASKPRNYQTFKERIISCLPGDEPFVLTSEDIARWRELHDKLVG